MRTAALALAVFSYTINSLLFTGLIFTADRNAPGYPLVPLIAAGRIIGVFFLARMLFKKTKENNEH